MHPAPLAAARRSGRFAASTLHWATQRHRPKARGEFGGGHVLQQVPLGAGADGGTQVDLVLAPGQHQDAHLGAGPQQSARGVDARRAGESQLEDDDVGLELLARLHRARAFRKQLHTYEESKLGTLSNRVMLLRSHLHSDGARYELLKAWQA